MLEISQQHLRLPKYFFEENLPCVSMQSDNVQQTTTHDKHKLLKVGQTIHEMIGELRLCEPPKTAEDFKQEAKTIVIQTVNRAFESKVLDKRAQLPNSFETQSQEEWARWVTLKLRQYVHSPVKVELLRHALKTDFTDILKGIRGYCHVSEMLFGGDMKEAYQQVSAVLKALYPDSHKQKMDELGWGAAFMGHTKTVSELFKLFEKELPSDLKGIQGYISFADSRCDGDMQKAYIQVSAVLKALYPDSHKQKMDELGWGAAFMGHTKTVSALFKLFEKELPSNLKGIQGYISFAVSRCDGDMQKAYMQVSAVIKALYPDSHKQKMDELGWGKELYGKSHEIRDIVEQFGPEIFSKKGRILLK